MTRQPMRRARKTPLSGNASLSEWRFPLSECHCPPPPSCGVPVGCVLMNVSPLWSPPGAGWIVGWWCVSGRRGGRVFLHRWCHQCVSRRGSPGCGRMRGKRSGSVGGSVRAQPWPVVSREVLRGRWRGHQSHAVLRISVGRGAGLSMARALMAWRMLLPATNVPETGRLGTDPRPTASANGMLITHNPQPEPGHDSRSLSEGGRWRARNTGQSSRKGRHAVA